MGLLDERIDDTKVGIGLVKGLLLQCSHVATFEGLVTMTITKLSSRDFNQDTSRAKRAAKRGPVFITDRGRPSHVLLTVEEYERITEGQKSVVDLLAMPAAAEIEFEPPRLRGNLHETADLT
jgi:prevent-host-death family protein